MNNDLACGVSAVTKATLAPLAPLAPLAQLAPLAPMGPLGPLGPLGLGPGPQATYCATSVRTPAIILDTRLNDTQGKGTHNCDECEKVFQGPF